VGASAVHPHQGGVACHLDALRMHARGGDYSDRGEFQIVYRIHSRGCAIMRVACPNRYTHQNVPTLEELSKNALGDH